MKQGFFKLALLLSASIFFSIIACKKEAAQPEATQTFLEEIEGSLLDKVNHDCSEHDGENQVPISDIEVADRATIELPVGGTGWYHYGGSTFHQPSSGFSRADDTYAFDLNLAGNADKDKPVYAVTAGTVKQVNTGSGWVLIEHPGSVVWKGIIYSKFYVGYLHMKSVTATVGASVSAGTQIGKVGKEGGASTEHLHFAFYVGELNTGVYTNARLLSVNPANVSPTFVKFDYGTKIYDNFVDDLSDNQYAKFVKSATSGWLENWNYGMFTHMTYTNGSTAEQDAAVWGFLEGTQKTASDWKFWVYIPSNYATATVANYKVYEGTTNTLKGNFTINQSNVSDKWIVSQSFSLTSGQNSKVRLGDGGNSGKIVGFDMVRRWKKNDANITIN